MAAGDTKWKRGTLATLLSTELNTLAANQSVLGSAHAQETNLNVVADFELVIASGGSYTAGDLIADLYLIKEVDSANYEDSVTGVGLLNNPDAKVGSFVTVKTTGALRISLTGIVLPSCDFKALIHNRDGAAFPSSGNTLKMQPYFMNTASA